MHELSFKLFKPYQLGRSGILLAVILTGLLLLSGCAKASGADDQPVKQGTQESEIIVSTPERVEAGQKHESEITTVSTPGIPANNQKTDPQDQTDSPILPEKFEVLDSDMIPEWKKLEVREALHQFESNGQGMNWRSLPESNMIEYEIHYPGEWDFNGFSVFSDREKNKVAELAPVAIAGMVIDTLFEHYQPSEISEEEPVVKEVVTFAEYKALKLVEKVPVMYGQKPYWYSHMYLISDGVNLFTIIFYTYELTEVDEALFAKIAGTFRFK